RMEHHPRAKAIGPRCDGVRYIRRDVTIGHLARSKAGPERDVPEDPIDTKGPPVAARLVPRRQVPARARVHETVRLRGSLADPALDITVAKARSFVVAARGCERRE